MPVVLDTQFRNQMLNSLESLISFCSEQMSRSIEVLEKECDGSSAISQAVIEQQFKIKDIEQTFYACVKSQPFVLSKVPLSGIDFINNAMSKFADLNNSILESEIAKINKAKAEML